MRSHRSTLGYLATATIAATLATATPAAATDTANQRFVIMAHGTTMTSRRLTATGPISGVGTDTLLDHNLNPDGTFTDIDRFDLPLGQVILNDTYTATVRTDPTTCVSKITVTGTYHIVSGTGHYTGATGTGTFTATGTLVAHRDPSGSCLDTTPPTAYEEIVHGTGSTTLPR
ncbi:MAG TPA: hypothetical protein VFP34_05675 [Microlunatus sp.]|nr:hypothetical protein [Microlunatus sp.]